MEDELVIAAEAGRFMDRHFLSSALNVIAATVGESYQDADQMTVDLRQDPEVEDFECLAVTLRVRGSVAEILESERKARSILRRRLPAADYRKFVLSYEIPA